MSQALAINMQLTDIHGAVTEQLFLVDPGLHTPSDDGTRPTASFKKRQVKKSRNQAIIIMIKADKLTILSISSTSVSQACSMKTSQIAWIYQVPRYTSLLDANPGSVEYPIRISDIARRTTEPWPSVCKRPAPAVNFTPKSRSSPLKINTISNSHIRHSVH